MGFMDDVRRAKQAAEAQPEGLSRSERRERVKDALGDEDRAELERWCPPGSEAPYLEVLETKGHNQPEPPGLTGWRPTPVEAYLRILALRPEDCFGIWPASISDSGSMGRVVVAYRDRPEYAEGRERYAQWSAAG